MSVQPQLLQIPLDPGDVVYTPDWVARDMVEFFKPSGRILEPCKGDGVFLKYLPPHAEWCEIQEGRDFFKWVEPVDWVFGNPVYKNFTDWLSHSFRIADNVVFLVPLQYVWVSTKRLKVIRKYGGIMQNRAYPESAFKDWSINFMTGAIHFQRGYRGPMYTTIYGQE
jgi:hypothetical protein